MGVEKSTEEDAAPTDAGGEDERPGGFSPRAGHGEGLQEGDDAVLGDGLQEAGRAGQRLQPRAQRRQERADQDDPLVGPRDVRHHQLAADALAKPAIQILFSINCVLVKC